MPTKAQLVQIIEEQNKQYPQYQNYVSRPEWKLCRIKKQRSIKGRLMVSTNEYTLAKKHSLLPNNGDISAYSFITKQFFIMFERNVEWIS